MVNVTLAKIVIIIIKSCKSYLLRRRVRRDGGNPSYQREVGQTPKRPSRSPPRDGNVDPNGGGHRGHSGLNGRSVNV